MIYCGYQGVGKSTYCKEHKGCIDLDSSNFKKVENWFVAYVETANAISNNGENCFISAHQCVITYLIEKGYQFTLVIPCEDKETWRARLEFRYHQCKKQYALNALFDFDKNFEKDMAFYKSLNVPKIFVNAKIVTTLAKGIEALAL